MKKKKKFFLTQYEIDHNDVIKYCTLELRAKEVIHLIRKKLRTWPIYIIYVCVVDKKKKS